MRKLPNVRVLLKQGELITRKNSPVILAGMACGGVVGTAYLAWKAGHQIAIDEQQRPPATKFLLRSKERTVRYWREYLPPVITGAVTIGCIITSTRVGVRRTAAMAAAYSVSERAFTEYREKMEEKLGTNKERAARDEIAQDKVTANPIGREIVLMGLGPVPCYEIHGNRYFYADMETLNRARNEINDRILRCDYATLAEFHELVGIPTNRDAGIFGWTKEGGLLTLEITTTLTEESRPCIAFSYNYLRAL